MVAIDISIEFARIHLDSVEFECIGDGQSFLYRSTFPPPYSALLSIVVFLHALIEFGLSYNWNITVGLKKLN